MVNSSPYLGNIDINPNKNYYVKELRVDDDDFIGLLDIRVDRPVNIYVFDTHYDEDLQIFVGDNEKIFKTTEGIEPVQISLSKDINTTFMIVIEYSLLKAGIEVPLDPKITFKNYTINDLFHSDFYMYESKSGMPYPAYDIGTYSRYEFEVPNAMNVPTHRQVGVLCDVILDATASNYNNNVTQQTVEYHVANLIKGMMGYHVRSHIFDELDVTVGGWNTKSALEFNINLIAEKYKQNKVIIKAEDYLGRYGITWFNELIRKIITEPNFEKMSGYIGTLYAKADTVTLINAADDIKKVLEKDYTSLITTLINTLFDANSTTASFNDILKDLGFSSGYSIGGYITDKRIYRTVNQYISTDQSISGRLDIQGQSAHTGKYASSKILIGHVHENERGYLKHTLATDRFGKTHKDPFVKNKELWGKEEDYIYLDLLNATKNMFTRSNKTIRGVALLVDKQIKERPKGKIIFHFYNKDIATPEDNPIMPDVEYNDVYCASYQAPTMIPIDDTYYSLLNNNYFTKVFVRQTGMTSEFIFWYTERIGTFIYKFVDVVTGEDIADEVAIPRKVTYTFDITKVPIEGGTRDMQLIQIEAPDPNMIYEYTLSTDSTPVTKTARCKDDVIYMIYKYKMTTSDFVFKLYKILNNHSNVLFDFNDILNMTYWQLDPLTNQPINTSIVKTQAELLPPENVNPIVFADKPYIIYNPPTHISIGAYDTYKRVMTGGVNASIYMLQASLLNPEIVTSIYYELITSTFIYYFKSLFGEVYESIMDPVQHEHLTHDEYTADTVVHTLLMAEDEYYVLNDTPLDTSIWSDTTNYPTVVLRTDGTPIIEYTFYYSRLLAEAIVRFLNINTNLPINVDPYYEKHYYINENNGFASLVISTTGATSNSTLSKRLVIPETIFESQEKRWELQNFTEQKFIATEPDQLFECNVLYKPIYEPVSVTFNMSSTCELRSFAKFLLIDENGTILKKFDIGDEDVVYNEYGLNMNIHKTVTLRNSSAIVPHTEVTTAELLGYTTPQPSVNVETVDHAYDYVLSFKGDIVVDIGNMDTSKTIKLVGFTNLISNEGYHPDTHEIFRMLYNNGGLAGGYCWYNSRAFARKEIMFNDPALNEGMKFDLYVNGVAQATTFATFDFSGRDDSDSIFTIHQSHGGSYFPTDPNV